MRRGDRSPPARRGCDDPRGRHAGRHPRLRSRHVHADRGRGRRWGRPSHRPNERDLHRHRGDHLSGGHDDDELLGGAGVETFLGGPGDDEIDGNQGPTRPSWAPATTASWDPGDGSDKVEGCQETTRSSSTVQAWRELRRFRQREAASLLPRPRQHRHGRRRYRAHRSQSPGGADTTVMNDLRRTDVERSTSTCSHHRGDHRDGQADTVTLFGSDSPGRTDDVRSMPSPTRSK